MKFLCRKSAYLAIGLSLTAVTGVADIFSHTVLNLPYEYRSEESWSRVINTQQEWESFYDELIAGNVIDEESLQAPEIDFEQYRLITGGLGVRSSGGYSLSVDWVREFEDEVYIHVLNGMPGSDCLVTLALTYPTTAILIKKTEKSIRFFISNWVQECGTDTRYD